MDEPDHGPDLEIHEPEPQPSRTGWSWWRWPLVIPAFLALWYAARWAPFIGTRADYSEDRLIWIGYTLAGFLPVFVAAMVAPARRLPVAIACAAVVAIHVATFLAVAFSLRDDSTSAGVFAIIKGQRFLTLTGAASAVWIVWRTRTEGAEGSWKWVWATGIILPVALFVLLAYEPKIQ